MLPDSLDSKHKALYIFYVLQLDYAIKSQILYNGGARLYKENKEFFTPENISSLPQDKLTKYLKDYLHPRYVNEAVKRFGSNTGTLVSKYNGDPRKIFENTASCREVVTRLKDFRGFGPKIGTFFIRTMINTFNYNFSDIDSILPPVDIHDVRIAYLMAFTNSNKMTSKNINFVKKMWSGACVSAGESWLVFDKALWLLGSEGKPKTREDVLKLLG